MAVKPYQAQAEGELSISKGEKIKGMLIPGPLPEFAQEAWLVGGRLMPFS